MFRLSQVIRRHREIARTEREFDRAYRGASGSDMRAEISDLAQWSR